MANQVAPAQFDPLAVNEDRVISYQWAPEIGSRTIQSVEWWSRPSGLSFDNASVEGQKTIVTIRAAQGAVTYRVNCKITVQGLEGSFMIRSGDHPGAPIWVLPEVQSGSPRSDYAYGNL